MWLKSKNTHTSLYSLCGYTYTVNIWFWDVKISCAIPFIARNVSVTCMTQIPRTTSITRKLSVTTTCSWWTLWMPNIPDLCANCLGPACSAEKKWSPSTLRWCRWDKTRSCCRCSVARPRISLTSSRTYWTTLDNNMSAITSQAKVCLLFWSQWFGLGL